MQIFDEIKSRGVEDILFISMDGVSGLEERAKAIFPNVTVQRCIVHLIRITELYKKWNKRPQSNWALVRNQLDIRGCKIKCVR